MRGLNAIDTADVYSRWAPGHVGGESETIIGRWLKARPGMRDKIVLITKVGSDMGTRCGRRPGAGPVGALDRAGGRGQPAPAGGGDHRPLFLAPPRRRHPA
jgi:aryl-alcohol dehydrogenase-like predicted oxidoreductase